MNTSRGLGAQRNAQVSSAFQSKKEQYSSEVIASLRNHATVLELELVEIKKDIQHNRTMGKKYGALSFADGEKRLTKLLVEKTQALQRINDQLQQLSHVSMKSKKLAQQLGARNATFDEANNLVFLATSGEGILPQFHEKRGSTSSRTYEPTMLDEEYDLGDVGSNDADLDAAVDAVSSRLRNTDMFRSDSPILANRSAKSSHSSSRVPVTVPMSPKAAQGSGGNGSVIIVSPSSARRAGK